MKNNQSRYFEDQVYHDINEHIISRLKVTQRYKYGEKVILKIGGIQSPWSIYSIPNSSHNQWVVYKMCKKYYKEIGEGKELDWLISVNYFNSRFNKQEQKLE